MENNQHSRFKDAPWYPKEETEVLIGGAGGIGSWLSLLLSRAGFLPMVYDFDILEEHNLGGQLYGKKHIGLTKVDALSTIISEFSGTSIVFNEKITSTTMTHKFAFSAFDNMEARRIMFEKWASTYANPRSADYDPTAIFIDGRLLAEQVQILCVRASDTKAVENYSNDYIFADSEVEDAPCTFKQTSHSAAMIASHMVGFFTNHMTNITDGDNWRVVPFYWEYFIPVDIKNDEL